MTTRVTEHPGYEAICPWHHRQPFADGEQYPTVISRADAPYSSWAPVPGNSTPSWIYVGTKRVNCGTFYVQPGGWFDPGNHPNPEPYYILKGTLHLSNPDTSDVIEIRAGDASNIPAFAYHHAWNFGDEVCEILWWVPGEMHTEEFKAKIDRDPTNPQWYERTPVMLNWPQRAERRLPVPPRRPEAVAARLADEGAARHAAPSASTWLRLLQGTDPAADRAQLVLLLRREDPLQHGVAAPRPRVAARVRRLRAAAVRRAGGLSVNLTGTGKSLLAGPNDLVFLPPFTEHSLQAIGDEPVRVLSALAFE